MRQKTRQPISQLFPVAGLASPNHFDAPAHPPESPLRLCVPCNIPGKFFPPEFRSGFRRGGFGTSLVPVPEASVNENNRAVSGQDNVGFAGQIFPVQPEPESESVEN